MDPQEAQLRRQISDFVDGTLGVHAFRDWFRVQEWEADPPEDWPLIHLIIGVDKRLAVFNSGDFSSDQLRQSLGRWSKLVGGETTGDDDPLHDALPMVRTTAIIRSRRNADPA